MMWERNRLCFDMQFSLHIQSELMTCDRNLNRGMVMR